MAEATQTATPAANGIQAAVAPAKAPLFKVIETPKTVATPAPDAAKAAADKAAADKAVADKAAADAAAAKVPADLAARFAEIDQTKNQLAKRMKDLEAMEARLKPYQDLDKLAKEDPEAAAARLGLSYEAWTAKRLGKLEPEKPEELARRLAAEEIQKFRKEYDEKNAEAQKAANAQAVENARRYYLGQIDARKADFPIVSSGYQEEVLSAMAHYAQTYPDDVAALQDVGQFCQAVEDQHIKQMSGLNDEQLKKLGFSRVKAETKTETKSKDEKSPESAAPVVAATPANGVKASKRIDVEAYQKKRMDEYLSSNPIFKR
jgi:hypothetical protein